MELRHCGLDDCTILVSFQSSVKYFQVGRYCCIQFPDVARGWHINAPFWGDNPLIGMNYAEAHQAKLELLQ